ncbi:MAG: hypothetical protein B6I34_02755 [Anaerolineaceae bacterium 4572_32.1]|nr:MAG: hypothetical protein B6I34_02755 [Anaerolineaceae bacterium 4572_32.1]
MRNMKVARMFGFKAETPGADSRSGLARIRWSIAYKLTAASVLMIMLTLLAGGVGLWQVLTIGQAISEVRAKEQQRAHSLELLAAGQRLITSLDRMLLTQNPALMSTDVPVSLGTLIFHMEALQEAGGEPETLDLISEMQESYSDLLQVVSEVNVLARQERWTEVNVVLEQEVEPVNKQMNLFIRRLVQRADQDVKTVTSRAQATVTELRQGVARIVSGDLEHKIDIKTGDEIEELGAEFNKMADELFSVIGSLEQRVADRTRGLQAAAEVASATTLVLDPDELLQQVVNLVRERFDLYYVGLFLLDEERQFAVLRAGTGEAGQEMLAQKHALRVGGDSMIGQCTFRTEARIALDVGKEAVRFDNPLLPDTRSEMALPLIARGTVIGAMTVQSVAEAAFDEAEVAIMQTMADQVAVAIDNARLFAEAQSTLGEMEATQQRYLGRAWAEYVLGAEKTDYETKLPGVAPLGDAVLPEIRRVVEQQGAVMLDGDGSGEGGRSALVAPITLRGKIIGALGIHDDAGTRQWAADDVVLIDAVAERLALAVDNLRLLDETQRRAATERLTAEVTARVRETLDVETVLKTAVDEIYQALGLEKVAIRLATGEADEEPVSQDLATVDWRGQTPPEEVV